MLLFVNSFEDFKSSCCPWKICHDYVDLYIINIEGKCKKDKGTGLDLTNTNALSVLQEVGNNSILLQWLQTLGT